MALPSSVPDADPELDLGPSDIGRHEQSVHL